ncbi:hypothetical protein [Alteromonas sp. S015]|uniref:hypothetical protein n=1 Tax=Alteromonas sp. S015 TaxID=3117401 RepID=UPI002FE3C44B
MFKKFVLSSLCLSVLVACGGGSSDSSNMPVDDATSTPPSTEKVVTVIDGYLSDASVCGIESGSTQCLELGTTNEQGQVFISGDFEGRLVATIKGGNTKDTDRVGFVPRSYQMIADIIGEEDAVITPFTMLDSLNEEKTLEDLSSYLNLPLSVLEGDYIASDAAESAHVHALARAVTGLFSNEYQDNDIEHLFAVTKNVNNYITTELVNIGVDLNSVNILADENEISHKDRVKSLRSYLEQGTLNISSMNAPFFAREGVREITFGGGTFTLNGYTGNYTIDGDELTTTANGESETDVFLYMSSSLSLSVPVNEKDLTIISPIQLGKHQALFPTDKPASWEISGLAGKTRYLIFDDARISDSGAQPAFVKLEFGDDTVTLTEAGESKTVPWKMDLADGFSKSVFEITLEERVLQFSEILFDGNIAVLSSNRSITPPTLMLNDEALAKSIYNKWKSI